MTASNILGAFEAAKGLGLIPSPPAQVGTGAQPEQGFLASANDALRAREIAVGRREDMVHMQEAAAYNARMSDFGWNAGKWLLVGGVGIALGSLLGLFWRGR